MSSDSIGSCEKGLPVSSATVFAGSDLQFLYTRNMPQRQGLEVALNYLSRVYFRDPSDLLPCGDTDFVNTIKATKDLES